MKGVVEIEFVISVFIFITSMSFVTFLIVSNIPAFHNTAVGELVKSRSYQFAEVMFFDQGAPTTWSTLPFEQVQRIGFSDMRRYFISSARLSKFAEWCQPSPVGVGYQIIKNRLGLEYNYDIIIEASYLDGSPVVGTNTVLCEPPVVTQLRQQFSFTKLGILNTADMKMIRMKFVVIR